MNTNELREALTQAVEAVRAVTAALEAMEYNEGDFKQWCELEAAEKTIVECFEDIEAGRWRGESQK